jgi:hypothetical protein
MTSRKNGVNGFVCVHLKPNISAFFDSNRLHLYLLFSAWLFIQGRQKCSFLQKLRQSDGNRREKERKPIQLIFIIPVDRKKLNRRKFQVCTFIIFHFCVVIIILVARLWVCLFLFNVRYLNDMTQHCS